MTKIGSNIKKIRQTKGLSQQAFAEIFGISRGNISSYEENRAEPKIETIIKIANNFSIPLEGLLLKDLSINEILQYNADKILEEEVKLNQYKLKEIPLINDDILAKVWHGNLDFSAMESFPKICLPDTTFATLLAISFNINIPHHKAFEQYKPQDIFVLKLMTSDNMHLADGRLGLYMEDHIVKLGEYKLVDSQLIFFIHADNYKEVSLSSSAKFWILNSHYTANLY